MRKPANKTSATNIYIVCEGSKSEPWFLRRFIEWVDSMGYDTNYVCDIFPTPKEEELDKNESHVKKSGRKNYGRKTVEATTAPENTETPKGGNPFYWVEHGISKKDTYSEIYIVFDKDGHPKMKEAFELAKTAENINIIFNSRSFEYYMLLHFERIYRAFEKTECGEKRGGHTRSFHCCLPDAVKDKECRGKICINGYARLKGYWENSKDENTFLSASNIWRGMANGEYIRNKALRENNDKELYELNPYVEFQCLLARLLNMRIFRTSDEICLDAGRGEDRVVTKYEDCMVIANNSSALPMKLKDGWLNYFSFPSESRNFKEIKAELKSESEANEKYALCQGEKSLLRSEPEMAIPIKESIKISAFQEMPANTFAILTLESIQYLIFNN